MKLFRTIFFIVLFLLFAKPSYAWPFAAYDYQAVANQIMLWIGGFAVFIGVFMIPYAGILMASGNPENIKKGREVLISYVSGLVLVLGAGIILRWIAEIMGF